MALDRAVEEACLRIGWSQLYEEIIDKAGYTLGPPSARGERSCRSPFPFSDDNTPSFNVNIYNGLWRDWHIEKSLGINGGNIIQFMALMNAPVDEDGKPSPNFSKTERSLKVALGISNPVDIAWLQECRNNIESEEALASWKGRKSWDIETLKKLGIGWDSGRNRIVIPVYEKDGHIANTRLYKPNRIDNTIPKYMWSQNNCSGNFLFPLIAWTESYVILVEGEGDVLSLRSFDYNAASGTMGSGNPVPEGLWWYGKTVYIWMDCDASGKKATEDATHILLQGAANVYVVDLPFWEGRSENADVSDWILYLQHQGLTKSEIQREITIILKGAKLCNTIASLYDSPPVDVPFNKALSTIHSDTKIKTNAHVMTVGTQRYKAPTIIQAVCPGTGTDYCKGCPMHIQFRGNAQFRIDPRSRLTLKLVQCDDEKQERVLRKENNIPSQCPLIKMKTIQSIDLEVVMLTSTTDDDAIGNGDQDKNRLEGYIIANKGNHIESNADYELSGFVYPTPTKQKLTFVFDTKKRLSSRIDSFDLTTENRILLEQFKCNTTTSPYQHIYNIAKDMADSVTMIHGRIPLHIAYLIMFHSTLSFNLYQGKATHGLVEMLVVGDTRCGKSATFQRMGDWYGIGAGALVDCKMQTVAGVLGAVETSTLTGERFVLPGILPLADRKVICFDEFSANKDSRATMMDNLSSARAERMVRINKAAHATFVARVRLAWLSNPGQQKLMSSIGGYGVECIKTLITQPEDIARFDYALAVAQEDVSSDVLNSDKSPAIPLRSRDAANAMLAFAWSRKPENIQWGEGAEDRILYQAGIMCEKYNADIPLVEPADQRNRIAKVAISIATLCYSTDETGANIIVQKEHVDAALHMFYLWYDNPTFGYDKFSARIVIENRLDDIPAIIVTLNRIFGNEKAQCAARIVRLNEFTEDMFSMLLSDNIDMMITGMSIRALIRLKCINFSKKNGVYTLSKSFIKLLNEYITKHSDNSTNLGEEINVTNETTRTA